jgi:hypothetical protein
MVTRRKKKKTCVFPKDRAHYLTRKDSVWCLENQRYVIYDIEADPTDLQIPNKVVVKEILILGRPTHGAVYTEITQETNLIAEHVFGGYDCIDKFCEWLLMQPFESNKKPKKKKKKPEAELNAGGNNSDVAKDKTYKGTTVIAHNQKGYDARFVLAWCQKRSFIPDNLIRSGSKIQYMYFKAGAVRFIDSLNFFLEPLRELSKSYDIKTLKGWFPHTMNTPEYQNYDGPMPPERLYDPGSMSSGEYDRFKTWYDNEVNNGVMFNLQVELHKYCEADVELLTIAVLKFRHIFIDMIQVDPFAYITLASLCKAIFIHHDLPERSIVGNENNKTSSKVSREWLLQLQNTLSISMHEEQPIYVEYVKSTRTLSCTVMNTKTNVTVPEDVRFKHYFTEQKNPLNINKYIYLLRLCQPTATVLIQTPFLNSMVALSMAAPVVISVMMPTRLNMKRQLNALRY